MIDVHLSKYGEVIALEDLNAWRLREATQKEWLTQFDESDYQLMGETRTGLQQVSYKWSFSWVHVVRFKNELDAAAFKLRFGI